MFVSSVYSLIDGLSQIKGKCREVLIVCTFNHMGQLVLLKGRGDSVNQQRQPPWHVSHIQTTSFIPRNPKVPLLLPLTHKQNSTPTQPRLSAGSAGG